jgi:hypothetical protein
MMDIGGAIKALNEGKKVSRSGWNGKGMYLTKVDGDPVNNVDPHIVLKTANGSLQPGWNAATPDLFALDWGVVD